MRNVRHSSHDPSAESDRRLRTEAGLAHRRRSVWRRLGTHGAVQARPQPDLTVAALITNGSTEQLRGHLARAKDNGLTEAELKEAIIHLAFYAGWPRAMSAVTVAKEIFGG